MSNELDNEKIFQCTLSVVHAVIAQGQVLPFDVPQLIEKVHASMSAVANGMRTANFYPPASLADADESFEAECGDTAGAVEGAIIEDAVPAALEIKEPFCSIEDSHPVHGQWVVCLEDGKRMKLLKRYLLAKFGLTPEAYIARWNLPKSYKLVSGSYSESKRKEAEKISLGKKVRSPAPIADGNFASSMEMREAA